MSKVPLTREEEKGFTTQVKRKVWLRSGGRCEVTGQDLREVDALGEKNFEYDHIYSKYHMQWLPRGCRIRKKMNSVNNCMLVSKKYNRSKSSYADIELYCMLNGISRDEFYKLCEAPPEAKPPEKTVWKPMSDEVGGKSYGKIKPKPVVVQKPKFDSRWWTIFFISLIGCAIIVFALKSGIEYLHSRGIMLIAWMVFALT